MNHLEKFWGTVASQDLNVSSLRIRYILYLLYLVSYILYFLCGGIFNITNQQYSS